MELPWAVAVNGFDTTTVTVQGSSSDSTRRTRKRGLSLATNEDIYLAINGDFLTATDTPLVVPPICWHRNGGHPELPKHDHATHTAARY